MFEKMILFQKSFQQKIYSNFDPQTMTYDQKVEYSKHYVLCAHEELTEIMSAMKYKNYHMYSKEYNEDEIKVEIIDCLKFILNLGILWGMDADGFNKVFDLKSEENLKRIKANE